MEFPSWWESPLGDKKHFLAGPVPEGWVKCEGHYNFETGAWVNDPAEIRVNADGSAFGHDADGKPGGSKKRKAK